MKNIILMTCVLIGFTSKVAFSQFEGRGFLTGQASISFANSKTNSPDTDPLLPKSFNDYGYGFDVSFGKFKTNTRATGWRLSNSLNGGNTFQIIYTGGIPLVIEKKGITGVGVGVGKFWQYYKHFNDKIGIYAGPNVDVSFSNGKTYTTGDNSQFLVTNVVNRIQLSAGLSAGIYYNLTPKWWLTASLAFANPVSIDYSFNSVTFSSDDPHKTRQLNYKFSPSFNFPSVGLGVRYFLGK